MEVGGSSIPSFCRRGDRRRRRYGIQEQDAPRRPRCAHGRRGGRARNSIDGYTNAAPVIEHCDFDSQQFVTSSPSSVADKSDTCASRGDAAPNIDSDNSADDSSSFAKNATCTFYNSAGFDAAGFDADDNDNVNAANVFSTTDIDCSTSSNSCGNHVSSSSQSPLASARADNDNVHGSAANTAIAPSRGVMATPASKTYNVVAAAVVAAVGSFGGPSSSDPVAAARHTKSVGAAPRSERRRNAGTRHMPDVVYGERGAR